MSEQAIKTHARVVVIGGGIAGCSTLYHLTREGWRDVVLVERDELTSGSTWHAAAQVTQFGANQTMFALKRHSIDLYRELASDGEPPFAYHITGGMGVDMAFIDATEAGQRHPLLNTEGLLGAWWDPLDGDIDPAGTTFALARKAREAGAEVYRFNPVEGIARKSNGEFVVRTRNGDILCEKLVNACGYRVNEVGAMLGVRHPVTSMEHMYFLTEPMAELESLDSRVPIIRDPGDDFYSRQEKHGLLVGVYEQACKPFGMDGIDPGFTRALCPSDLDRCLDNMDGILQRLPALATTGIHTVINGPITYTIDGAPLVGPVPGVENAFCATGLRAGIGESGGYGKILAEIMVHGESEWDAWYADPRRFSGYGNTELTCLKAVEDYQNEFHYHLPREHRPAGRLARTTPLYAEFDRMHCAWGVVNGWERSLFFKPESDFVDVPSYRFTPTDDVVARGIDHLRQHVSLMEVSGFNRYELRGEGVEAFLDKVTCSRVPRTTGKLSLCYLLTQRGNVLSEATVVKMAPDRYWWGSAAAAEWHDRDWLNRHKPESVSLRVLTSDYITLVVAGPRSRELLQSVSPRCDWSLTAFPWLHCRPMFIGHAEVVAMNVSYSGELAYELHVPNERLYLVWTLLNEAGAPFEIGHFGLYATESMRLEKGFLHWKADLIYEHNPYEARLERFVKLDKGDFIGKAALIEQIERGPRKQLATLTIECDVGPAHGGDPVFDGARQIGSVTSGAYGHRVSKNIAFAYIDPERARAGTELAVGILGKRYPATIVEPALYDPTHTRARS